MSLVSSTCLVSLRRLSLCGILLLMLAFPAFAQINSSGDFVSNGNEITFRPPYDWRVVEGAEAEGALFVCFGKPFETEIQGYEDRYIIPAISFDVDEIPAAARKSFEKVKLEDVVKFYRKKVPQEQYKLLRTARITVGGVPALAQSSTFLSQRVNNHTVLQRSILIRHSGRLYFFALNADPKGFKEAAPAFEEMLKTVRFLDKK